MKNKKTHKLIGLTIAVTAVLVVTVTAQVKTAKNYTVDNTSDNASLTACTEAANDCSLRGAINNVNGHAGRYRKSPGTIDFDDSLSDQTITLGGSPLIVDGNLTINGLGAEKLSVSGDGKSTVFVSKKNGGRLTLNGITVTGGKNIEGCGGGIEVLFDELTLDNTTVSGNSAEKGGGICFGGDRQFKMINSTVSGNKASSNGGGIYLYSGGTELAVIEESTITNNTASKNGGGLYAESPVKISADFIKNKATEGGGIWANNNLTLAGTSLESNTASWGGALYFVQGYTLEMCCNNFLLKNVALCGNGYLRTECANARIYIK